MKTTMMIFITSKQPKKVTNKKVNNILHRNIIDIFSFY